MFDRSKRVIALVFALALVAAACGQKDGVHVAADRVGEVGPAVGPQAGTAAQAGDDLGDPIAGTGESGTRTVERTVEGSAGPTAPGDPATPAETGDDTSDAAPQAALQPQGSDRTGVSDDTITIGFHAPATGAAPLPTTSFEVFADSYWRWVIEEQGETILGRTKVNVVFRDDKYTPSSARQVCRELMSTAFLLVGGGGTDQLQACGDLSNESQVPYLSNGVTERGLRGLPWYFTTSMSYRQQAELLAQYAKANLPGKVGMIVTDTPNFDDAVEGWQEAVARHGLDDGGVLKHPKGDTTWYESFGNELANRGVENVYFLSAPVDYIDFAKRNQNHNFQFMGVGVTQGLNAILPTGCDAVHGGTFFSPAPGLDWARDNLPEFFQAGERFGGRPPDDIAMLIWQINATIHEMLKRYEATFGQDLTREDFRAMLEQQQGIQTGVGPVLNYTPDDHFGANEVHVLQADCNANPPEYKTLATFATGF